MNIKNDGYKVLYKTNGNSAWTTYSVGSEATQLNNKARIEHRYAHVKVVDSNGNVVG